MKSGQPFDPARESGDKKEKRLVERLREAIRTRHYSRRTEKAYWYWIRWFVFFHASARARL